MNYTAAVLKTPLLESENARKQFLGRAGAAYGVVVALGFALSFWLPDALILRQAAAADWWYKLALGLLASVPFCALIGWLAARARWSAISIGFWIVGGIGLAWLGGRVAFDGVSLIARLSDPYPSAQVMYPFTPSAQAYTGISMTIGAGAGLLVGLLSLMATDRAWERSTSDNRLSARSVLILLVGLPPVLLMGVLADFQIQSSLRAPLESVGTVIAAGVDRAVDLRQARLVYLEPYRDQMSSNYVSRLSSLSPELDTGSVDVTFDTGLMVRCQFGYGAVFLCARLDADLVEWLTQLLTAGHLTCNGCAMRVERDVRRWLNAVLPSMGALRDVRPLNHLGGWFYLRGTFDSGRAIDCRLQGNRPIVVNLCVEVAD